LQTANAEKRKQAIAERERHEAILKGQYESGEITEAEYKTLMSTETQNKERVAAVPEMPQGIDNPYGDGSTFMDDSAIKDLGADLTEEDKTFLLMK
jgi:hypothetical protein